MGAQLLRSIKKEWVFTHSLSVHYHTPKRIIS